MRRNGHVHAPARRRGRAFLAAAGAAACLVAGALPSAHGQDNAAPVRVTRLTSFYSLSEPWLIARHPTAPPLQAANGRLYITTRPGNVSCIDPTPSHYENCSAAYVWFPEGGTWTGWAPQDGTYFSEVPGALVQSAIDGRMYGAAVGSNGAVGRFEGVFTTEFDGAGIRPLEISRGKIVKPNGVLLIDAADTLHGLDQGPDGNGRLFRLKADGDFHILHAFGAGPQGQRQMPNGMIRGSDGWFYGVTAYRRGYPFDAGTPTAPTTPTGTLYRIHPDQPGSFTVLHTFTLGEGEPAWNAHALSDTDSDGLDGRNLPLSWVVEGADGWLYGGLGMGSCRVQTATAVRIAPACGGETSQAQFYDMPYPHYDGPNPHGTLYRIRKDGSGFTMLRVFSEHDGSQPRGPMVAAPDGYLYGTTLAGGSHRSDANEYREGATWPRGEDRLTFDGTLFRIDPARIRVADDGTVLDDGFTLLHAFRAGIGDDTDGKQPTGLVLGSDGRFLFGTTLRGGAGYSSVSGQRFQNGDSGTVFEVDTLGEAPKASVTITADRPVLLPGENVTITWSSFGATDCIASGGAAQDGWEGQRAASGSVLLTPVTGVHYYTMTCLDALVPGRQVGNMLRLVVDAEPTQRDGSHTDYGNGGALGAAMLAVLAGGLRWRRRRSRG